MQSAMRVPDATSDCGDQKQGHCGTHESVGVHNADMMTSSDDDIKTAATAEAVVFYKYSNISDLRQIPACQ
jgi:hypothetical protein